MDARLAKYVRCSHHGILHIRPGLAVERQRILVVEGDYCIAREAQEKEPQCTHADGLGDLRTLGLTQLRMTRVRLCARGRDHAVDQVVGLHSEALASADLYKVPRLVFLAQRVSKPFGRPRRKPDERIVQVRKAVTLRDVSQRPQRLLHLRLRIVLARVHHVVDGIRVPEAQTTVRPLRLKLRCRNPARMRRVLEKLCVAEVLSQKSELPQVVGDVLAYIRYGPVGPHQNLGVFIRCCRPLHTRTLHHPAAFVLALGLEIQHALRHHQRARRLPEVQVQNLALARQKVVLDAQPLHRLQVPPQDTCRNQIRNLRGLIAAGFYPVQRIQA